MIHKFANCYNHCQKENVPFRQVVAGLTMWFFHLKLTGRMNVEHDELGQQQNIHILTFFYFSFDFFCRFHYTNIIQVHFKENMFYTPNVPKWPKLGKKGTPNIFLKLVNQVEEINIKHIELEILHRSSKMSVFWMVWKLPLWCEISPIWR